MPQDSSRRAVLGRFPKDRDASSRRLRPAAIEALEDRRVPASVSPLKDVFPLGDSDPKNFLDVGGTLFFDPIAPGVGRELWKSDGTPGGTVLVEDIRPGALGSEPFKFVAAGGRLFFVSDDGSSGDELWTSDGTAAGTVLLKDIRPGITGADIAYLTASGDRVYFSADDGVSGAELWTSDGTPAGTVMVADLDPGPRGSDPHGLIDVDGTLFFGASDGAVDEFDQPLPEGLYTAVDVTAGLVTRRFGIGLDRFSCNFNGVLYASDGPNLFRSDGTDGGTQLVKSLLYDIVLPNGDTVSGNGNFGLLKVINGVIYTEADEGMDGSTSQLWKSDGTAGGTRPITDFPGGFSAETYGMVGLDGLAYFAGRDQAGGYELWRTDGTPGGTIRVADINPGAADSQPLFLTTLGDSLFFNATGPAGGTELWQAGGGISGAMPIVIHPGDPSSFPAYLTLMGDAIYFAATRPDVGREPFKVALGAPTGSAGLDAAGITVREAAGTLSVTLTRNGGGAGALTVRLTTADGTAKAGRDYAAVDAAVTWVDGDATPKTVSIPIFNDTVAGPDRTFTVNLCGAAAGGITLAVVTIRDDDPPSGPGDGNVSGGADEGGGGGGGTATVADLVRLDGVSLRKVKGKKGWTTVIQVRFNGDLATARAANRAAYTLSAAGRPRRKGLPPPPVALAIGGVTYDAEARTVTITPAKALKLNPPVIFKIAGDLLTDAQGRAVDGDRDDRAGGTAIISLSKRGVTFG